MKNSDLHVDLKVMFLSSPNISGASQLKQLLAQRLQQRFWLWKLWFPFGRYDRHCSHTSMRPSRWHSCQGMRPLEGTAQSRANIHLSFTAVQFSPSCSVATVSYRCLKLPSKSFTILKLFFCPDSLELLATLLHWEPTGSTAPLVRICKNF